jgi:hypothetical protein
LTDRVETWIKSCNAFDIPADLQLRIHQSMFQTLQKIICNTHSSVICGEVGIGTIVLYDMVVPPFQSGRWNEIKGYSYQKDIYDNRALVQKNQAIHKAMPQMGYRPILAVSMPFGAWVPCRLLQPST